jgi:hypothetical protein
MPGIVIPDLAKPTPSGTLNGHDRLNGHGNGHVDGDGRFAFTSSAQSINDYSYGSEGHSEPHEHGSAEPIAIIGMGSLLFFNHLLLCALLTFFRVSFTWWKYIQFQTLGSSQGRSKRSRTISSLQIQYQRILSS